MANYGRNVPSLHFSIHPFRLRTCFGVFHLFPDTDQCLVSIPSARLGLCFLVFTTAGRSGIRIEQGSDCRQTSEVNVLDFSAEVARNSFARGRCYEAEVEEKILVDSGSTYLEKQGKKPLAFYT